MRTGRDEEALIPYTAGASVCGALATIGSIVALPGWEGATLGVGQGLVWCGALLARHPRPWLANVVVFGLVAGVVELLADWWLVRGLGVLAYPPEGPFVLASPAYMPAAWLGMLVAGVTLGVALRRRWPVGPISLAVAAAFGAYVPAYEAVARVAGWWAYRDAVVPAFVILGEVLIGLPLVGASERLARVGLAGAARLGVAQGLWI